MVRHKFVFDSGFGIIYNVIVFKELLHQYHAKVFADFSHHSILFMFLFQLVFLDHTFAGRSADAK